jgi:hypothetical protein
MAATQIMAEDGWCGMDIKKPLMNNKVTKRQSWEIDRFTEIQAVK